MDTIQAVIVPQSLNASASDKTRNPSLMPPYKDAIGHVVPAHGERVGNGSTSEAVAKSCRETSRFHILPQIPKLLMTSTQLWLASWAEV